MATKSHRSHRHLKLAADANPDPMTTGHGGDNSAVPTLPGTTEPPYVDPATELSVRMATEVFDALEIAMYGRPIREMI